MNRRNGDTGIWRKNDSENSESETREILYTDHTIPVSPHLRFPDSFR